MKDVNKKHTYLIYLCFAIITCLWILFLPYFHEDFINKYCYMPFLGTLAATVANTTPAAAGIVYFPILTRLHITPADAVQFNLMIQAYGMGLGTFKWFLFNRKLFILNILPVCLIGGSFGMLISIVFFPLKKPELLTIVFNLIAFVFTQVIFFSMLLKTSYPESTIPLTKKNNLIFFILSFAGGAVSGWIGFGIDTIFYFTLTLIYRINPAVSIVTSISLMAAMSIVGAGLHLFLGDVPLSLWFSAIPGVTLAGLFFASFFANHLFCHPILWKHWTPFCSHQGRKRSHLKDPLDHTPAIYL